MPTACKRLYSRTGFYTICIEPTPRTYVSRNERGYIVFCSGVLAEVQRSDVKEPSSAYLLDIHILHHHTRWVDLLRALINLGSAIANAMWLGLSARPTVSSNNCCCDIRCLRHKSFRRMGLTTRGSTPHSPEHIMLSMQHNSPGQLLLNLHSVDSAMHKITVGKHTWRVRQCSCRSV